MRVDADGAVTLVVPRSRSRQDPSCPVAAVH